MNQHFRLNVIKLALCLAFPGLALPVFAVEPYPALPPTLSTSLAPNVMLYIDTSGSMLQDTNNAWMLTNLCNSNQVAWNSCVDNNTNGYRTAVDSPVTNPNSKMNIAKRVATNLVNNNTNLRFGLFSFEDRPLNIGGAERSEAGVLRAGIKDMTNATDKASLFAAIAALNGRTATPLGEGLMELTRYFEGKQTLYAKAAGQPLYTSPIQYRCQKNFAIVITDGDASGENNLPGSGQASLAYTARDSNGGAVAKTFSVCTAADANASDDISVNCPAGLELANGTFTANQAFLGGQDGLRFRALRDVAKYARVADLRVGGNDLDGKSFDDPKFAKQNLTTYTVGFTVNNDVLPAAAKVGGGKYFNANSEAELSSSLTQAVDSIVASISNAGGVATQSEATSAGNKVFQPVFNPTGWYGELRCLTLNSDGTVGAACTPNAKAVIPTSGRKVFTAKVVGQNTTAFDFNETNYAADMTATQKTLLGADATAQQNTIKFIRGVEGIAGFRSRYNSLLAATVLLGDIVDGQPAVVSKPSGATPDADYAAFATANAARNIVLVGANDGMMHAFGISDMTELMGYVPSAVYPRLKGLTATDYGSSAGTPHAYHVNGSMRQQDVKVGTTPAWKTLVVGGVGQGGQGYYAVDATSSTTLSTSAATAIKWEYTDVRDSSMGYTLGAPIIYNVRASATAVVPAVIFSNGYESNWDDTASGGQKAALKDSALYIVNADTGVLIKKITVPVASTGLSSPAGVDFGQDGILDYVYAGDVNGNIWRFDLTSDDPNTFKVIEPPIYSAGAGQPIIMRPGVMAVNKASDSTVLGNMVFFGTGQLLTNADRSDLTTQTIFGVLDTMADVPVTVLKTQLQEQKIDAVTYTTVTGRLGTYRKITTGDAAADAFSVVSDANLTAASPKLGWFIDLPESSERLVTSPMVYNDKVLFGTGVPVSAEKCLPGGKGWVMGLNPLTGALTRKANSASGNAFSFIDINGDGKSSTLDKLAFATGSAYMSGYSKDGIPTELTYVSLSSTLTGPADSDSGWGDKGGVIALREANSMAVYTGNQKKDGTVKRGKTIKRAGSVGTGTIYGGVIGSDTLEKDRLLGAPVSAAKVVGSTWREIK